MVEVKKRYPDFEEKAVPALKKFFDDPEVPDFIKGTVGSSDVKHDLIYTLGDPETWAKIVDASKTDPRAALKAIFAAEDAIAAELSGKKSEGTEPTRPATRAANSLPRKLLTNQSRASPSHLLRSAVGEPTPKSRRSRRRELAISAPSRRRQIASMRSATSNTRRAQKIRTELWLTIF
jgi:hypothetical protein